MPLPIHNPTNFYYPNVWARHYFDSFRPDVHPKYMVYKLLGLAGFSHLGWDNFPPETFERAVDFVVIAGFTRAVREMYGPNGSRVMIYRASQRWFATFTDVLERRLGPDRFVELTPTVKIPRMLATLATIFSELSDQDTAFEPVSDTYLLTIKRCPFCTHQQANKPICDVMVGFLETAISWVSPGTTWTIHEIECCAIGSSVCTFRVAPDETRG